MSTGCVGQKNKVTMTLSVETLVWKLLLMIRVMKRGVRLMIMTMTITMMLCFKVSKQLPFVNFTEVLFLNEEPKKIAL